MKIVFFQKFIDDYRAFAVVDADKCVGCGICLKFCPFDVPVLTPKKKAGIEPQKCSGCGACLSRCKAKAIGISHALNTLPYLGSKTDPPRGESPLNRRAVDAVLSLRDRIGGTVCIVGMGPPRCREVIREALAMDVDEGLLLCDERFLGSDLKASALILEKALRKMGGCDLLVASADEKSRASSLSLAWVAENMGMTYLPLVTEMEIAEERLLARCAAQGNLLEYSLCAPAAVSILPGKGRNRRGLSLMAAAKALGKDVPVWSLDDLGMDAHQVGETGSSVGLAAVWAMPETKGKKRNLHLLEGSPQEAAQGLVALMKNNEMAESAN